MSEHKANIQWQRQNAEFSYENYSRDHQIEFENNQQALASAAPGYKGNPLALNPETLLIGALASCHMLTFLAICAKRGFIVDQYSDQASATLGKNSKGQIAITHCVLRPKVMFSGGKQPDQTELDGLHEKAHKHCFIASSLDPEMHFQVEA